MKTKLHRSKGMYQRPKVEMEIPIVPKLSFITICPSLWGSLEGGQKAQYQRIWVNSSLNHAKEMLKYCQKLPIVFLLFQRHPQEAAC